MRYVYHVYIESEYFKHKFIIYVKNWIYNRDWPDKTIPLFNCVDKLVALNFNSQEHFKTI